MRTTKNAFDMALSQRTDYWMPSNNDWSELLTDASPAGPPTNRLRILASALL
ncbi:hypothetical protein [Spirosoma validum]|uniref:Uncharacterized protein n=1 Tax=Spirosoma validum TaxID=2771355 RepID=A0A927GDV9_9BACT|nr:hypothetical protein [Spirosoma validum]MBD2754073.1 hypothetical protein [Spirosoma validum]